MAQIIIEVPDEKIGLVGDAVRWKLGDPSMTNAEAATWIDGYLTGIMKQFVRRYQEQAHMDAFAFDDPAP